MARVRPLRSSFLGLGGRVGPAGPGLGAAWVAAFPGGSAPGRCADAGSAEHPPASNATAVAPTASHARASRDTAHLPALLVTRSLMTARARSRQTVPSG